MIFLAFADFFENLTFSKNSFRNTIRVSNSLEPDQAGCSVWSYLSPSCLQRSAADNKVTHWQRVENLFCNLLSKKFSILFVDF